MAGEVADGAQYSADNLTVDCTQLAQKEVNLFSEERYGGQPRPKTVGAGAEGEDEMGSFYSMSASRESAASADDHDLSQSSNEGGPTGDQGEEASPEESQATELLSTSPAHGEMDGPPAGGDADFE